MFKDAKKGKGADKPPSPLRNPQTLVVVLDPLYANKYANITYTPHGWIGVNRNTGGEELLPRGAFKLVRVDELV